MHKIKVCVANGGHTRGRQMHANDKIGRQFRVFLHFLSIGTIHRVVRVHFMPNLFFDSFAQFCFLFFSVCLFVTNRKKTQKTKTKLYAPISADRFTRCSILLLFSLFVATANKRRKKSNNRIIDKQIVWNLYMEYKSHWIPTVWCFLCVYLKAIDLKLTLSCQ